MQKLTYFIIAVILILGGVYFLTKKPVVNAPESPATPLLDGSPEIVPLSQINYTLGGFLPSTLTVTKGTTVTFFNSHTENSVWPASAFHPTHIAYPTTGGCIGSTFDACAEISPGGSWQFTFDIPGTFKYHNHLSPPETGTIVVE
ncbi:MAG TPA: hypothetical protein VJ103_02595 [Candidatus Paceibacterota bacterium]|nr:hypothetical protein [Candidatus Paceibacterota bacterium]